MGQKNLKGTVSIFNDAGRIRLRWRYHGQRYSLSAAPYTRVNLLEAKKTAVVIEEDIREKRFDVTLGKYKKQEHLQSSKQAAPFDSFTGRAIENTQVIPQEKQEVKRDHVQWFEKWTRDICNMDCDVHRNYYTIRNMMKRWEDFTAEDVIGRFANTKMNNKTYNRRRTTLVKFYNWVVKAGYLKMNPLEDVMPKRVTKSNKDTRKPYTVDEISRILKAFKNDTYCPKASGFKHSHYYPFMYFIFKTGTRNAEAVGLLVQNIDFENKSIEIKEALARTLKGSHAAARIRKETKNQIERYIPLTPDLQAILKPIVENKKANDLVFQSPKGNCIDDRMFQKRILKVILKGLEIPPRVLYACRHTFGTRCIEAGLDPVKTSALMGNNPETVLRNYVRAVENTNFLPALPIEE